ncbi:MAG TPA: prepilin-type N-terminal cleavage/methylation domain-containing protein [Nitrospiria bacterium]
MRSGSIRQKGFTLIELLVALGIMAVLIVLVYETFNGVLRSVHQVDEATEIDQMARISLAVMTRELRSAYRPPSVTAASGGGAPPASSSVFLGSDGLNGEHAADSLTFQAFSHASGAADPTLSGLTYDLVPDGETGTFFLMHREQVNLLSEGGAEAYELAEGVVSLNFRYYNGKDWSDQWDDITNKDLPRAVEIEILFKDSAGGERRYGTQTDIPLGVV